MNNKWRFTKSAVLAAVAGAAVGASAGFWAPRQGPRPLHISPTVAATVQPLPVPVHAAAPLPLATEPERPSHSGGGQSVLERAAELAKRADVAALIDLRDEVARKSGEPNTPEWAANRHTVEELDRYITAARQLRLKLDGDQLQKSTASLNLSR